MLVVRLQRRGRKKHAQYRIVVQDSHRHPTSGKVVSYLGSYNPHTKTANFDSAKTLEYINHGAHPSERVVRLLLAEKAKLPKWVKSPDDKRSRSIRNPEKLRKNRPAEEKPAEEPTEVPAEEPTEQQAETPESSEPPETEPKTETPAQEETPSHEPEEKSSEDTTESANEPEEKAEESTEAKDSVVEKTKVEPESSEESKESK